jgi:hypothetical protein
MTAISAKGTKMPHEGVTPFEIKTATTDTSRTKKSKTGWPRAAMTKASRGKFNLVTKDPDDTKLIVQLEDNRRKAARH